MRVSLVPVVLSTPYRIVYVVQYGAPILTLSTLYRHQVHLTSHRDTFLYRDSQCPPPIIHPEILKIILPLIAAAKPSSVLLLISHRSFNSTRESASVLCRSRRSHCTRPQCFVYYGALRALNLLDPAIKEGCGMKTVENLSEKTKAIWFTFVMGMDGRAARAGERLLQ